MQLKTGKLRLPPPPTEVVKKKGRSKDKGGSSDFLPRSLRKMLSVKVLFCRVKLPVHRFSKRRQAANHLQCLHYDYEIVFPKPFNYRSHETYNHKISATSQAAAERQTGVTSRAGRKEHLPLGNRGMLTSGCMRVRGRPCHW